MARSRTFRLLPAFVAAAVLCGCQFTTAPASSYSGPSPEHTRPRQAPAVLQLYSPPHYRSFVSRSVPYGAIARQTKNAAVASRLRVREVDMFSDDYYERHGTVVMLGHERGAIVGFTTRYSIDIRYPDDDLIQDGVGRPDFRDPRITISPPGKKCSQTGRRWCSLEYRLTKAPRGQLRFVGNATAYYRTFGDNDAVLLYFPPQLARRLSEIAVRPLGLEYPTAEVVRTLTDATKILGREFVLVSPESLGLLRKKAHVKSVLATYGPEVLSWAAGLLGAHTVVRKLMTKGVDYFTIDRRKIQAAITLEVATSFAAQELIGNFDFHGSVAPDRSGGAQLPPLHLVEVPYENSGAAAAVMQQIVGNANVELVLFGKTRPSAQRGMLFVPSRYVNLNYELVRNGMARLALDSDSREGLRLFPEFAAAAGDALAAGTGYAAQWRHDTAYVSAVQELRDQLR